MTKILFVCHGNICRSPMAEFVMKDLVLKEGLSDLFHIESAATSTEEIGSPVHHGTRNKLASYGISTAGKAARRMVKKDYEEFDYLIGMDRYNISNMNKIAGNDVSKKIHKLPEFAQKSKDIADPWYTGNFDETYEDVLEGCIALLSYIRKDKGI